MTPVSITLPPEQLLQVKLRAQRERRSLSNMIAVLLERALASESDPLGFDPDATATDPKRAA